LNPNKTEATRLLSMTRMYLFMLAECPLAEDGLRQFSCPTPDRYGVYRCIDDHTLCDRRPHCPNGEDEDLTVCMFHHMVSMYVCRLPGFYIAIRNTYYRHIECLNTLWSV